MSHTEAHTLEEFISWELVHGPSIAADSEAFNLLLGLLSPARDYIETTLERHHTEESSWRATRGSMDLSEWLPDDLLDDILDAFGIYNECSLRQYMRRDRTRFTLQGSQAVTTEDPTLEQVKDHIHDLEGRGHQAKSKLKGAEMDALKAKWHFKALEARHRFWSTVGLEMTEKKERALLAELKAKYPDEA